MEAALLGTKRLEEAGLGGQERTIVVVSIKGAETEMVSEVKSAGGMRASEEKGAPREGMEGVVAAVIEAIGVIAADEAINNEDMCISTGVC